MTRETIAIVSGGFKPLTSGHFFLIESASKIADKVILFVSTGDRIRKGEMPIFWTEQMEKIWAKYLIKIMPKNVEVIFAPNPTSEVFKTLGAANDDKNNSNSYILFGDLEDTAKMYPEKSLLKYFPRLVENEQITVKGFDRQKNINISGTAMRGFVANNDVKNFINGLPPPARSHGKEIFAILHTSVNKTKTPDEKPKKKK